MSYDIADLSNAQIWRFPPDLARGFELRRSFRTDIFTSRNGKEQRRATRDRPRFSTRFDCPMWRDGDLAEARLRIAAAQNAPTAIPDYTRRASLASGVSAGSDQLDLGSMPDWIAEGSYLILCNAGDFALVQVESIYLDVANLTAPLADAWATGTTIRRALVGLLNGSLRARSLRRGAQTISIELEVYPSLIPDEDEGASADSLDGDDIFDEQPDFAGSPGSTYQFPVEQIDFGIGRTAQFRPIEFGQELVETLHSGLSVDEMQRIERAFLRSKGSRAALWRPTGEKDVIPASGASGTQITATGPLLASLRGSIDYSEEPLGLAICLKDGSKFYRRVTNIAAVGGNSRITISASVSFSLDEVARISFMNLVRFAGDDLIIEYGGPNAISTRLRFQGIRQ